MEEREHKKTYADDLTLDEIRDNDIAMVADAIKNANRYHFGRDMQKASLFVRDCMDRTLKRCGIKVQLPASRTKEALAEYAKRLDKEMHDKQVKIETRRNYTGNDQWRCGVYIYQRDELVAFISDIFTTRRTEFNRETLKITGESVGIVVITNARTDDSKRIFLMPGKSIEMPYIEPLPISLLMKKPVGGVQ
jgi:hypothetical protein